MMPTTKPRAVVTFTDTAIYAEVCAAAAARGVSVSAWLLAAARARLGRAKKREVSGG